MAGVRNRVDRLSRRLRPAGRFAAWLAVLTWLDTTYRARGGALDVPPWSDEDVRRLARACAATGAAPGAVLASSLTRRAELAFVGEA